MSQQQGRHQIGAAPRTRGVKIAGAGFAGLTAAFALAPVVAQADTPAPSATPTAPASSQTPGTATPGSGKAVAPAAVVTTTSAPTPDYGTNKIRVGVQIKDGAYAPGATTVGTQFTIVETGDGVSGGSLTTTCTTGDSFDPGAAPTSYCEGDSETPYTGAPFYEYVAQPGDTVTITQKTVQAGLVIDSETVTVPPCTQQLEDVRKAAARPAADPVTCSNPFDPFLAMFTDPGLPPKAVDDSATTKADTPVTFSIRGNDTPVDPDADLAITSGPSDGTVTIDQPDATPTPTPTVTETVTADPSVTETVMAQAAALRVAAVSGATTVTYTPKAGFVGVDHFRYSLTTANGTASALVTVTVTGAAATATATPTSSAIPTSASSTPTAPIASTGTPTAALLETGLGLVAAGALAGAAGRRRRRGRHAG